MKRTFSLSHGFGLLLAFFFMSLGPGFLGAQCLINDNFNNGVLPPPWNATSINAGAGSDTEGAALTITSIDTGINAVAPADSFRYTYMSVSGDSEIILKIVSMPPVVGARLGLMFRYGTGNGDIYAFVGATTTTGGTTPSGNFFEMSRAVTNTNSSAANNLGTWTNAGLPVYVRILKAGTYFNCYYSTDGTAWTRFTTITLAGFPTGTFNVGIAMGSTSNTSPGGTGIVGGFSVLAGGLCTATATYTATHTVTSTWTATPTPSHSFTPTVSFTPTLTATWSPSNTSTDSPTDTPTATETATDTETSTETNTFTDTFTLTETFTPTPTSTDTATFTSTHTDSPTFTSTDTPTPSWTTTYTSTLTSTPTFTSTSTPTSTETPTYTPTQPALQISAGSNNPGATVQIPGMAGIPMLQMVVANNSLETVDVNYLRLTAVGLGNDATGILSVRLWRDNDGNGTVSAGDVQAASGVYGTDNGFVTMAGYPLEKLTAGTSVTYLVAYDFSSGAPSGTYQVEVAAGTDLSSLGETSQRSGLVQGTFAVAGGIVTMSDPTPTYTDTSTNTPTPTSSFTPTSTPTPTATSTNTFTSTPTATPSFTSTPSNTPTETPTWTSTSTFTPTSTSTNTPTATPTFTSTPTPTVTNTYTTTFTPTHTATVGLSVAFNNQPLPQTYVFDQANAVVDGSGADGGGQ
jgi:hypothetical protein